LGCLYGEAFGWDEPNNPLMEDGIYHVLNPANARVPIFESDEDFEAFERILQEVVSRTGALREKVELGE